MADGPRRCAVCNDVTQWASWGSGRGHGGGHCTQCGTDTVSTAGVALDVGRRGGGRKQSDVQIMRAVELENVPPSIANAVARQARTKLAQLKQRATRGKSHAAVQKVLRAQVGEEDSVEKVLIRAFALRKIRLLESDVEEARRRLLDLQSRGRCTAQAGGQDVWLVAATALTVHGQWRPSGEYEAWRTSDCVAETLQRCALDFCADKKVPNPALCAKAVSHIWRETMSTRLAADLPWLASI